jgi:HPt (histidine-containing phosphotransfer) domain-containing protein
MTIESLPSRAVLDIEATLARFGGDRQLFQDFIGFFLQDSPPLLAELRRAAQLAHAPAVRSAAHALRGLAAGCGGVRAAQAAQRVENAGAEADLKDIDTLVDTLEREFELVRRAACDCQSRSSAPDLQ